MLNNFLKNIAAKFGILNAYDRAQRNRFDGILRLFEKETKSVEYSEGATFVVFSKDRPLQLELLLRSYSDLVKNPIPVKVLFHSSNSDFKLGYTKLINEYSNSHYFSIEWVEEKNFRKDLIQLFESITTNKVIFLVDDIFFKNEIDLDSFTALDTSRYVPSLRMGEHLSFSYTLQKNQKLPVFTQEGEFLSWKWKEQVHDWAYPLSVDGHLFNTSELKILVKELAYKAPNSFEAALQIMGPLFSKRKGLCYPNSVILNNPCNKVQNEHGNVHGETDVEVLNSKWLNGFRIQYKDSVGIKNESAHQEISLIFEKDE